MGEQPERSDVALLDASKQGDVGSFASLYERHAGAILRYCWAKVGQQHAAEDLAQETFVVAWTKRSSATVVDQSLLPWLLTISRNHCRNHLRKHANRATLELRDSDGTVGDTAEDAAWVRSELAKLSPTDQELCRLCLIEGQSYREAAQALSTTEAAVGKRLQRIRARLRAALGHE